jgi:DNA-binding LacI/PurR family transcriptional regulator
LDIGFREDISLIGFDDSDVGTIVIAETYDSACAEKTNWEWRLCSAWYMRIQHENKLPVTEIALPVNLVIRDSTYKKR